MQDVHRSRTILVAKSRVFIESWVEAFFDNKWNYEAVLHSQREKPGKHGIVSAVEHFDTMVLVIHIIVSWY